MTHRQAAGTFTAAPWSWWGHKHRVFDWYRVVIAEWFGRAALTEDWLQAAPLTDSPRLTRTDFHPLDLLSVSPRPDEAGGR